MAENRDDAQNLEQDSRFPSGPWVGFFLQPYPPAGKYRMELQLTFRDGMLKGEGRDYIGRFLVTGRYEIDEGKCWWTKRYLGLHDVFYDGYNEGKGIWGNWSIDVFGRGGFHIWPKAMGDPNVERLYEAANAPASADSRLPEVVVAP